VNEHEHLEGRASFLTVLSRLFWYWAMFLFCCGCWYAVWRGIAYLLG
jgi:hypothetical protein